MDAAFLEKQEGGDAGCLRGVSVSLAQPDREQFVHGRWISDIESVTHGCIPLDCNAGAAVSRSCLFTVTSRKNGSSCLFEIRSAVLNGAFIAVEMPLDNRTLHPGELLPFRIWENGHGWPCPWKCCPCGCRPWRFLKMCLHHSFPPSPKIFVPVRRKICCLNWNHGQEAVMTVYAGGYSMNRREPPGGRREPFMTGASLGMIPN